MPMKVSSIPENVSKFRPGSCTEIKLISGHYYVYSYHSVKLPSGNWGKQSGKCIGSIVPDKGFVPNKNYAEWADTESKDEITVLEYGQYALISKVAEWVKRDLEGCFGYSRGDQIFAWAVILYANGFTHLDQIQDYYDQCWLSLEYKAYTFKMGKEALSTVLDDLGRRTKRVKDYEMNSLINSSCEVAIDGHAIRSCSEENDLAETGYKFSALGEDQVNLLMGCDVNTGKPLFSRVFRGSCNDKATVETLAELLEINNILFIVDRGFYSSGNLELFSQKGNSYIIPIPSHLKVFKETMSKLKYQSYFYYRAGKKHARILYYERQISETERVLVFKDVDENEKCRYNYQHSIDLGKNGYTVEKLREKEEFFGVYVFQTNSKKSAKEVFEAYKKRWSIETFYQYLKNRADFNDLMLQDYYKEQGFAFIMLIAGQIHWRMTEAVARLNDNTLSIYDVLLKARAMKIEKDGKYWRLKNTRKKDLEMLEKMQFIPQDRLPA